MVTPIRVLLALALALLGAVAAAYGLPRYSLVVRSTEIAAAPATVYELLDDLTAVRRWSPWRDAHARYLFSGPRIGVGARMDWTGAGSSPGNEIIAVAEPYRRVVYRLRFQGSRGEANFALAPTAKGTRVTWRLTRDARWNPIARWSGPAADWLTGPELARGLDRLGDDAEALPRADLAAYAVTLVRAPGQAWVQAVAPTTADLDAATDAATLFKTLHQLPAAGPARVEPAPAISSPARRGPFRLIFPVRPAGV